MTLRCALSVTLLKAVPKICSPVENPHPWVGGSAINPRFMDCFGLWFLPCEANSSHVVLRHGMNPWCPDCQGMGWYYASVSYHNLWIRCVGHPEVNVQHGVKDVGPTEIKKECVNTYMQPNYMLVPTKVWPEQTCLSCNSCPFPCDLNPQFVDFFFKPRGVRRLTVSVWSKCTWSLEEGAILMATREEPF